MSFCELALAASFVVTYMTLPIHCYLQFYCSFLNICFTFRLSAIDLYGHISFTVALVHPVWALCGTYVLPVLLYDADVWPMTVIARLLLISGACDTFSAYPTQLVS